MEPKPRVTKLSGTILNPRSRGPKGEGQDVRSKSSRPDQIQRKKVFSRERGLFSLRTGGRMEPKPRVTKLSGTILNPRSRGPKGEGQDIGSQFSHTNQFLIKTDRYPARLVVGKLNVNYSRI